jgi:hypothetical protein
MAVKEQEVEMVDGGGFDDGWLRFNGGGERLENDST